MTTRQRSSPFASRTAVPLTDSQSRIASVIVWLPMYQSASPISWSTTASTRFGGTMPLQSKWPMFEQSESTRCLSLSSASA